MKYYAHTVEDDEAQTLYTLKDGRQTTEKPCPSDLAEEQIGWQSLRMHLLNVAENACEFGKPFGYGDEAYCAGLLHDLGKYGHAFQRRGYGWLPKHLFDPLGAAYWTPIGRKISGFLDEGFVDGERG